MKSYLSLTKPGIVMGNAITCAGGFMLASRGNIDFGLFFMTLLGLSLIVASGCVSNNYIDRHADKKMERTKNRPLARGAISTKNALLFSAALLVLGSIILAFTVNLLTLAVSLFGLAVYLAFYSFLKYQSLHATLVGSIAGAVPPVVGYTAVSHSVDSAAIVLFIIIALWQMPHFYAIAMYRLKEYKSASIPVLPLVKGFRTTRIHMLCYIIAFIAVAPLLDVGYVFLISATFLGLVWLALCIKGFTQANQTIWARKMFLFSLVVVMGICFSIPLSVI